MNLDNLPIIDWELATKLAGNKNDLAQELFTLLLANIESELPPINTAYQSKDYAELLARVHKLHGAVCYSGAVRLKKVLSQLETQLKNSILLDSLSTLMSALNSEVNLLLLQK